MAGLDERRWPTRRKWALRELRRAFQKEPQHFTRRVGPILISVRTFRAAPGPGMAQSVDGPAFYMGNAARGRDHGARIGAAAHEAVCSASPVRGRRGRRERRQGSLRRWTGVPSDPSRHERQWCERDRSSPCDEFSLRRRHGARAAAHRRERRNQVGGGAMRQARVDACRGVELGIGGAQDRGHRAAGRKARHKDPRRVELKIRHDRARDPGDDAGSP